MEAVDRHAEGTAAGTPSDLEPMAVRVKARLVDAQRFARTHLAPLFDLSYADVSLERLFSIIQGVATLALAYGCIEFTIVGFEASLLRGVLHLFLGAPALFFGGL
ncbi:MAG: hypothetical protein H5U40_03415, partial [Polyangiaceae bacterium]|nr:hypothetical protein [Polyangiaceae bacterium]